MKLVLANWPSFKRIACSTHNNIPIEIKFFKELINMLQAPFLHDTMTQEHVLPISLESDDFDKELLTASETLRELVEKYKKRKLNFNKQHETLDREDDIVIETSIFNHLASKIFIFVMAVISLIIVLIVIMLICKGEKMRALVTNLAMIKGVKALIEETRIRTNYEYWIIIAWLSLILIGIMFLTIEKLYKMPIFRKY